MRLSFLCSVMLVLVSAASSSAQTQTPPPEPKIWTVAASAGLALTNGNTDTSTVNAAYDLTYDPQRKNVIKSDALLIHGETDGELTADRLGFNFRDEYRIKPRVFVFGQNQYLRDEFKQIEYLVAPTVGVGYTLFNTERTRMSADAGTGVVWEKNAGQDVRTSGAVAVGERLSHRITPATTLTQSVSVLWKTKDFEDTLVVFGAGVAAAMSQRTQLKFEFLDTFKNKPADPSLEKNDIALLMAIVYKI